MTGQHTEMVTIPRHELADLEHRFEQLEEAARDAELALRADEQGWATLNGDKTSVLNRDELKTRSRLLRLLAVADPLARRAVNLRAAYVWGAGCGVSAPQVEDGQDVNAVLQGFIDDQQATFTGVQAREERERALATDGNYLIVLPTDPVTGRVQVRRVPADDVTSIITNPNDAAEPWFYKVTRKRAVVDFTTTTLGQAALATRTTNETVYYPALGLTWKTRPSVIDGDPIDWGMPVLHEAVNRTQGMDFGVPDLWAAAPWIQGYKDFLTDWARLMKALAKFAFQTTGKGSKAGQTRTALAAAATGDAPVGQTVITSDGQRFEAIGKSGATIDADSGRPLAAMIAAGVDVPVTMLLADPGITGARATAETLDKPTELIMGSRRGLHAAFDRRVYDHVIQSAIRAPRGMLRGARRVDLVTGREEWVLAGDQTRAVDIEWPALDDLDPAVVVKAVSDADATGKMPPVVTMRLLLAALGVDNVDELVDEWTDDDGDWIDPVDALAAKSQQAAVARGDQPGQQAPPSADDTPDVGA